MPGGRQPTSWRTSCSGSESHSGSQRAQRWQLQDELKEAKNAQLGELERIGGMTLNEAKAHLLERGEELVRHDLARRVRQLDEEARTESKRRARNLVADALQRVAASHAA